MIRRVEVRPALGVGVVIAIGGGLLWFMVEPILTPGALVRSTAWAGLTLLLWTVSSAWWRREDGQRRELRRRLKGIDWGGD